MLILRGAGGLPSNLTLPVIVPVVAGSTGDPVAGLLTGVFADSFSLVPQLANAMARTATVATAKRALGFMTCEAIHRGAVISRPPASILTLIPRSRGLEGQGDGF